ncbi:type VII secretion integral membrane protein EccD [Micromonospora profundi]|uniref:type VII secretion integral membrane protein EccD n=1 Tax=Micromonospora TaxID=1873 RepID=UPI0006AFD50B|nr:MULTISPECIES: type VII secretion integral membrane protein EccD [Micromonospora]KOX07978.1 secretion protein snm4 [Micromonospora sp. NRRL B-16802]NJC11538.1 type VII secretion integral membrane protein EccD [Micromonospora profundi]
MSAVVQADKCRITVVGPERRIDLAVPVTTTVAGLLPVLVGHAVPAHQQDDATGSGWVLQRLGGAPFELTGTPETLEWLDGEEIHLRRAEDPLPELDFDDLAEGVATSVNRRSDRWQPEYRRVLFLVLSAVAMTTVALVITDRGPVAGQILSAGVLAAAMLVAALVAARKLTDEAFGLLFGGAAALFAGMAAVSAVDGDPDGMSWTGLATLAAASAVVVVTGVLLVCQRTVTPRLPFTPLLLVGVSAATVVLVLVSGQLAGMTAAQVSAVAAAVILAIVVLAPRAAVKFARLRGPQLPKTGADLQYDIEPTDSGLVRERTADADTYLTAGLGSAALLLPFLFAFTMRTPGWSGSTLVALISAAVLLRARSYFGVWHRIALVTAGTTGCLLVVAQLSGSLSIGGRYVLLAGLVALLVPLVMAAVRPWPRRMLPFWEYAATFFDVVTALAVLPVLAQVLGLYGWARGLFG